MADERNVPIIIKRKKVVAGGGHHGGAWKVAYADFVTAMMAFFMLMWLLNATTEQQRRGLADYFAPTIPIARVSGGGADIFGGDDIMSIGAMPRLDRDTAPDANAAAEQAALREVEQDLLGTGGEAVLADDALRHVVTRLTDEGLVIEIFALPDAPIFAPDGVTPLPVTRDLVAAIARVSRMVTNPVAVAGHVATRPVVEAGAPVWRISAGRADAARTMLEEAGMDAARIHRMTGHGDRRPAAAAPLSVRNDRIEVTLLRRLPVAGGG